MWHFYKIWKQRRERNKLPELKAKANKCCVRPCQDPICQKIGCLNQDGLTLRPRIKLLLMRLERVVGDVGEFEETAPTLEVVEDPIVAEKTNVVDFSKYLKSE